MSPTAIRRVLVAATLLLTTWPPAPAAGAPGIDGAAGLDRVAFGIQPANADGGLDPRAFFQYEVPPAAAVYDNVALVNYSEGPIEVEVYAVDAGSDPVSGAFSPAPRDAAPRSIGRWLTVDGPSTVTVPAGRGNQPGTVVLPFTITPPADAAPGDHAGAILVSLTTLGENPNSQNVRLEQRVGVRVYLRVAGDVSPRLTISELRTTYRAGRLPWQAGSLQVRYRVSNSGNLRLGVQPSVGVRGPFGLGEQRRVADPVTELLPGATAELTDTIDGVRPLGLVAATVRLEALASPGNPAPGLLPVTASTRHWVLPLAAVVLAVVPLLAVVLILIRLRRSRHAPPPAPAS